MKLFTASQIRDCDAYTTHAQGIAPLELMERTATACLHWVQHYLPQDALFVVLCGAGNNGGDGLALTRLLHRAGYGAKAFLLEHSEQLSDDCAANLQRLQQIDTALVATVRPDTFITDIPPHIIIIDALLGTGLNRPVEGWMTQFIAHINELPNRKIAIDIPSGMHPDTILEGAPIVRVDDTLSFGLHKRAFLHPETGAPAGRVHLLDIGLDKGFIAHTHSIYQTTDQQAIQAIYRPRHAFGHKGTYGTACIAAGSQGMMGAAVLAGRAAMKTGAGKVILLSPECGYNIVQTAVPEAMCQTAGSRHLTEIKIPDGANAVAIGPGIGTHDETARALAAYIDNARHPIVLDADALNLLARHKELLGKLPAGSIITPHPKELERLLGKDVNSLLQVEHARTQAMRYNIHIVLKGHHTAVITPEGECWYNLTGNAGMATAGAGDVLTGMITGLLAQRYTPFEAALMGVYLHGLAGDMAAGRHGQESVTATDIINYIGDAYLTLAG